MHELISSESSTKRNIRSPRINNSIATNSCSPSPSSYENLAPMKTSNYMHTMNVYHHSAAFQQHYSGMNF